MIRTDSMVIYVPELTGLLEDGTGQFHEALGVRKADPAGGIREARSMYLTGRTVGREYFHSIIVEGARNRITFQRMNAGPDEMGPSVLAALRELGIDRFMPASLSYWLAAPGWSPGEDDARPS